MSAFKKPPGTKNIELKKSGRAIIHIINGINFAPKGGSDVSTLFRKFQKAGRQFCRQIDVNEHESGP